jgi:ectoine hydroxylase
MQILGTSVYIHQHSINAKVALEGDVFRWHQDSTYHKEQDGILRSNLVVSMVFLDEVNEFNGPLMIIPGSHKELIMNDWGTDFLIKRRRLIFPTI